jgi:hypothetical protein
MVSILLSNHVGLLENEAMTRREICKYAQGKKRKHKWLEGGVEFINIIPKSPSGKTFEKAFEG